MGRSAVHGHLIAATVYSPSDDLEDKETVKVRSQTKLLISRGIAASADAFGLDANRLETVPHAASDSDDRRLLVRVNRREAGVPDRLLLS